MALRKLRLESFKIAQDDTYGQLPPPNTHDNFRLLAFALG
jgi:hypothetical protein